MHDEIITHRGVVYPWQCDHMGHMNVMHYVGKFDEATWNLFALVGLTPSYLRAEQRGMVAVEQRLRYERELLAGDVILVRSSILEVRRKVLRFEHEMLHTETGARAATTDVVGVHIDRELRKSCPLPEDVVARAAALVGVQRTSASD